MLEDEIASDLENDILTSSVALLDEVLPDPATEIGFT
jgi:hypothetical protein